MLIRDSAGYQFDDDRDVQAAMFLAFGDVVHELDSARPHE